MKQPSAFLRQNTKWSAGSNEFSNAVNTILSIILDQEAKLEAIFNPIGNATKAQLSKFMRDIGVQEADDLWQGLSSAVTKEFAQRGAKIDQVLERAA